MHPNRIQLEAEEAVRLMESTWQDTQNFAFGYFENIYPTASWTPEILIGLCDSVVEKVREFGRKMITQCFQDQQGMVYLEHLSQHPAPDMQRFATHFLPENAAENPESVQELLPYFFTILSQPNQNRVGWERAIHFLEKQSLASANIARIIVPLLERVSATAAIGEKARYLRLLVQLKQRYPELSLPIHIQSPNSLPHAFFV